LTPISGKHDGLFSSTGSANPWNVTGVSRPTTTQGAEKAVSGVIQSFVVIQIIVGFALRGLASSKATWAMACCRLASGTTKSTGQGSFRRRYPRIRCRMDLRETVAKSISRKKSAFPPVVCDSSEKPASGIRKVCFLVSGSSTDKGERRSADSLTHSVKRKREEALLASSKETLKSQIASLCKIRSGDSIRICLISDPFNTYERTVRALAPGVRKCLFSAGRRRLRKYPCLMR
jgi:hypothetical protein